MQIGETVTRCKDAQTDFDGKEEKQKEKSIQQTMERNVVMISEHEKDNEHLLKLSTQTSKDRKRLAEIVETLMKQKNIKIQDCDVTEWHKLIHDAEKIMFAERRIV